MCILFKLIEEIKENNFWIPLTLLLILSSNLSIKEKLKNLITK
jgi:hypothetical protein